MALIPPRRDQYFNDEGKLTNRAIRYFEDLAGQTNVNTETVTSAQTSRGQALVFALENRIGSGDFLTSDETGFTVDSDRLSCDMDEA